MKWFKHLSNASEDEFIALLEAELGLEGYARWWKMLEAIAKQMDKTERCYAEYPVRKWMEILGAKQTKVLETFVKVLQKFGKVNVNWSENILKIECPKLLEFRDEYSRKSGHVSGQTPDKIAPDTDTDTDKKENSLTGVKENPEVEFSLLPPKEKTSLDLPDWLDADAWGAFVEMRKKIPQSPFTARAQKLAVRELERLRNEGHDPTKVLEQSVMRGWKGIFGIKDNQQNGGFHASDRKFSGENNRQTKDSRARDAVMRAIEGIENQRKPG